MGPLKKIGDLLRRGLKAASPEVNLGPRVDNLPVPVKAQPPAAAPLTQMKISRRDLLRRAGAQAVGSAMDATPLGALGKLAASPMSSKLVQSAAEAALQSGRTLTSIDGAARDALLWSLNESGDVPAMIAVWNKLRPELELGMDPSLMRKMDQFVDDMSDPDFYDPDTAHNFYEKLTGVLDKASVPPEVVHAALPRSAKVPRSQAEDWLDAVASEAGDSPTPEQLEALQAAMFGTKPRPVAAPAAAPGTLTPRDLSPSERWIADSLWGRMYTDNNSKRGAKDMLGAWQSMRGQLGLDPAEAQRLDRMAGSIFADPSGDINHRVYLEFNRALEPHLARVPPEYLYSTLRDRARLGAMTPEERLQRLRDMNLSDEVQPGEIEGIYRNMFGGTQ